MGEVELELYILFTIVCDVPLEAELLDILVGCRDDLDLDDRSLLEIPQLYGHVVEDVELFDRSHPLGEEDFDLPIKAYVDQVWNWTLRFNLCSDSK